MTQSTQTLLQRVRRATIESEFLLITAETLLKRHSDLVASNVEIFAEFRESARSFINRVETAPRQD